MSAPINAAIDASPGLRRLLLQRKPSLRRSGANFIISLGLSFTLLGPIATLRAAPPTNARNLADLSLEQLMNETVTSVSKKEQKLSDAAAAISVLSNEDLNRSGATSIAEALRAVPGLNVNGFNSSQWAVSARGFNGLYANKLLVLVDGRAVYTPLFAGVYWDLQQSMLADLDRIEVIRGPGASVWGANAVNGVINVESQSARDTQGSFVYGGGGDVHQALGGGRFGAQLGTNTFYRVFGSYQLNADYPLANGQSANDGWRGWHGGFRLDHYADADTHVTWQSDVTQSDLDDHASDAYNANMLGRWKRSLSDRSSYEFQAYYDRTFRNDNLRARSTIDTMDLTMEHTFGLGESHDLMWGLGYRYVNNYLKQTTPLVAVLDRSFGLSLGSAFLQDDWKVVPDRFTLTLGSKLEYNDFTGLELQPSLRGVLKLAEHHTLWAAASRAVRTPSEVEGLAVGEIPYGAPFVGPGGFSYVPTLVGNPNAAAEVLWAYEIGYRFHPEKWITTELNVFYNDYDRLITVGPISQYIPGAPGRAEILFDNYDHGSTYGGEAALTIAVTESWRLTASYALLVASLHSAANTDPEGTEDGSPRNQFMLRSAYDFSPALSLDVQCRYVDTTRAVSSYITADVHVSFRPTDRLELSVVGQNLLDNQHPEHRVEPVAVTAEVPRSVYGKVTWRF